MLVAEEKIEGEMYIALDGGFIVEVEHTSEIKGKIIYEELGDEEDAAFTRSYKIKLKKHK